MSSHVRDQVFISYSHKDDPYWLEKFETVLAPLKQTVGLQVWSDKQIAAGEQWQEEIEAAISRARVALLLVSGNFLASGFIANEELPKILEKHRSDGLFLYWVPITSGLYEETALAGLHAASAADEPLETLAEAERNHVITEIARDIRAKLGQFNQLRTDAREDLRSRVSALFRDRFEIGEEIGSGDTSVVFKARQGLRDVVVKALVPGLGSTRHRDELEGMLDRGSALRDPVFIPVHEAHLDHEPICIVRDYIAGDTLAHLLHGRRRPVAANVVASYVHQLARALEEAHQRGMRHGRLTPSNIFVEDDRIRLSAFDLSTEIARSARAHGSYFNTSESLSYTSPEHYHGRFTEKEADQYILGLIALEMLQGQPPIRVRCPAHLARFPRLFENPRDFFKGNWRREVPGLDRVIGRMLHEQPNKRFPSMRHVAEALEPLMSQRQLAEVHVAEAKQSYCDFCLHNLEFYQAFYARFLKRSRRAARLFAKVAMERQYQMLDEAIEKLLNFRRGPEPTTLHRVAHAHRRFRLTALDFQQFEEAFVETLQAVGEHDPDVLASWSAALRPGIDYLIEACAKPAKLRSGASRTAPAGKPAKGKTNNTIPVQIPSDPASIH